MKNKKGNARDVILIVVLLFCFGIGFFIINYVGDTMKTALINNEAWNSSLVDGSNASQILETHVDTVNSRMDYLYLGVFLGLTLALIITAWFVGGHPIFMAVYFLFVVIAVVLAVVFANVWDDLTNKISPAYYNFSSTIDDFRITNNILAHLPMYIAIIGIVGIIVMFAKPGGGEGREE